jgi:hypothetical protein
VEEVAQNTLEDSKIEQKKRRTGDVRVTTFKNKVRGCHDKALAILSPQGSTTKLQRVFSIRISTPASHAQQNLVSKTHFSVQPSLAQSRTWSWLIFLVGIATVVGVNCQGLTVVKYFFIDGFSVRLAVAKA